jgi:hypothetical protein
VTVSRLESAGVEAGIALVSPVVEAEAVTAVVLQLVEAEAPTWAGVSAAAIWAAALEALARGSLRGQNQTFRGDLGYAGPYRTAHGEWDRHGEHFNDRGRGRHRFGFKWGVP